MKNYGAKSEILLNQLGQKIYENQIKTQNIWKLRWWFISKENARQKILSTSFLRKMLV